MNSYLNDQSDLKKKNSTCLMINNEILAVVKLVSYQSRYNDKETKPLSKRAQRNFSQEQFKLVKYHKVLLSLNQHMNNIVL